MRDKGEVFERLMHLAVDHGIIVRFAPLRANTGRIKGNRLAIQQSLSIDDINYNLAHELAHAFLHYDKGDITSNAISSVEHQAYEEQADRAAKLLLCAIGAEMRKGGAA